MFPYPLILRVSLLLSNILYNPIPARKYKSLELLIVEISRLTINLSRKNNALIINNQLKQNGSNKHVNLFV